MTEFTCGLCGGTFPDGDEEVALREYAEHFGDQPRDDRPLCDDCYAKVLKANES